MKTRKSAFAGNTVPLKDGGADLLYPRYTDPVQVLLNPNAGSNGVKSAKQQVDKKRKAVLQFAPIAPAAAEAAEDAATTTVDATTVPPPVVQQDDGEAPPQKTRKKARWTDEQKEAAAKERKEKKAEQMAAKKEKKEKKEKAQEVAIRALAPEERISGPSNADEAHKIRETLGFVAPTEGKPAQASPGTFAFVFPSEAPPPAGAVNAAALAPAPHADIKSEEQAPSSSSDDSSLEDSSSSDDDDDTDDDGGDIGADAAVKSEGNDDSEDSSSSDEEEDEDSSDDSSSSSSSDEEVDEPAAKSAAAATTVPLAIGESEYVPRRVYVGGMPYSYTENDVREYWEYCGAVESMDILSFPDTGRFRGIAFITFATEEGYVAALACDGEACDGQTLKVQKCKWSAKDRQAAARQGVAAGGAAVAPPAYQAVPPPQHQQEHNQAEHQQALTPNAIVGAAKSPAPKTAGYDVAYVGNVAYEADEAALKALFEPYGLLKVRLHTDKDTGRSKGYAHVHFKDEESLDSAMALDGTNLMGRRIRVGYAQPKKAD